MFTFLTGLHESRGGSVVLSCMFYEKKPALNQGWQAMDSKMNFLY